MKTIPELQALLQRVENKYGRAIDTTSAFEALSIDIERQTGERISSSSLKRFWGYVNSDTAPRVASLDILAKYIGQKDFNSFCKILRSEDGTSVFFGAESLSVASLTPGNRIQLGWDPNRLLTLEYLGNFRFRVEESYNSKLLAGDCFELSDLIVGCPMFLSRIYRDGKTTPPYVAGAKDGITFIKILPAEKAKG